MISTRLYGVLRVVLWLLLIGYGLLVVRDFFRFADRLVYLALDDGLANQAYMLATEGRYGFLSSPTLFGVPRHFGEVSYGPWYFYAAGALIWLFGYSLTLVRSLHLWVVVGTVVASALWFPKRDRALGATVLGLAAFYCFDTAMWPMARPDSAVSAFAVAFTVCAGLAMTRDKARYWFAAGLMASCATFAHLIAWSVVPCCLIMFALWAIERVRQSPGDATVRRQLMVSFALLAAGGLLGAVMFYASFGFRFADQMRMFEAYGRLIKSSDGYWVVLAEHFYTAFDYVYIWQRWVLLAVLGLGWVTVIAATRLPAAARRMEFGYLLPPLLVWTGYLLSSGSYTNHHKAYAILQQLMAFWTSAALLLSWLRLANLRSETAGRWLAIALSLVVALQAGRQIQGQLDKLPGKVERASRWVSIADHTDRLLAPIPAGATAWGAVMYGIETPDRIQLVQVTEGMVLLPRVRAELRPQFYPEYLVWAYPEVRDNALTTIAGGESLLSHVGDTLAGANYRLVSIVAAQPYGLSRIYARTDPAGDRDTQLPTVSIYDAPTRRWVSRVGEALPVTFTSAPSAQIRLGYTDDTPKHPATHTMTADLPAGSYLLRATIKPGSGFTRRRMMTATSPTDLEQTIGELGPSGDFAGYFHDQTTVILLSVHAGGPLLVNQFDSGVDARLERIEVFPVLGLTDDTERLPNIVPEIPLPGPWEAIDNVRASQTAAGTVVDGDDSYNGYQVMSPPISARAGDAVSLSLDIAVTQGRVCTGILNSTQSSWIISPSQLRTDFSFRADGTGRFYVVAANCNLQPGPWQASRMVIGPARYRAASGSFYTDRLMIEVFGPALDGIR